MRKYNIAGLFPKYYEGCTVRTQVEDFNVRVIMTKSNCNVSNVLTISALEQSGNRAEMINYLLENCHRQLLHYIAEEAQEKGMRTAPKFKSYSSKWPLGPPGYFYNSAGTMNIIMEMKPAYVDSTISWLRRSFNPNEHVFAYKKLKELEAARLLRRDL